MYNYIYNLEKKWNNSSTSSISNINEISDINNKEFSVLNEFIVYSSKNEKTKK